MTRPARIVTAEHLGDLRLRVTFSDGLVRELDFAGTLKGGVLVPLNDPEIFARVQVDRVAGTVCWPTGIDLDPDVLHGDQAPASAIAPVVLAEYHLRTTG